MPRSALVLASALTSLLLSPGCSKPSASPTNEKPKTTDASPSAVASATPATPSVVPMTEPAPTPVAVPPGVSVCSDGGTVACLRFESPRAAFEWVAAHKPRVLAVGEAHAQKGTEGIASSTKRFTDELLPAIAPRSTDLLLELWVGDPRCKREVQAVASAQKPVTQKQAKSNPNEFVTLGHRAKALGVVPHVLRPTCDDYADLADAGADAVGQMLSLIRRLSTVQARALLQRNAVKAPDKMVVLYGGALHNDVDPPESSRAWSFGPDLMRETSGRYVEIDLIVPEFVKKTPVWEKLPWYAAWAADGDAAKGKTTLYRVGARSFALIFPRTAK